MNPFLQEDPEKAFQQGAVPQAAPTTNPFLQEDPEEAFQKEASSQAVSTEPYTTKDLVKDEYFTRIAPYMHRKTGMSYEEMDKKREEVADQFVAGRRASAVGNLYFAGSELSFLNSIKDEKGLAEVGAAYQVYDRLEGLTSDKYTWGETLSGIGESAKYAVLDPTNILAFTGGKFVAFGSAKAANKVAQSLAMNAYVKAGGKGATTAAAKEAANKAGKAVFAQAMKSESTQIVAQFGVTRAALQAQKNLLEKLTTKTAVKEILTSTAIGTLLSTGAEVAYQEGLVRTGVRENYDKFSLGVVALGGLVAGGIQTGAVALRGTSKLAYPSIDVAAPSTAKVSERLLGQITKRLSIGDWDKKVASGKELHDLDTDFFVTMLLGDKDKGLEGLTSILFTEGFQYQKAGPDDKITNWITDIIKDFDPQDAAKFLGEFQKSTGVKLPELNSVAQNIEYFSNVFAAKVSGQARGLSALSHAAKKLGVKEAELTYMQYAESMLNFGLKEEADSLVSKGVNKFQEFLAGKGVSLEGINNFQNNIIRGVVSNLGTTRLNVAGWAAATGMNSFTDLSMALIHGGRGGVSLMLGDKLSSKEGFRVATQLFNANQQRVKNLFDERMTYEAFISLANKRPEALRDLTRGMSGGVDDLRKGIKGLEFDPNKTVLGDLDDKFVDFMGDVSLAKAQDLFTKSQEFTYQLDKNLRISFDKGWSEFFEAPNAARLMNSEAYIKAESKAVYETMRAIYSKSYKDAPEPFGQVFGIIEDFRKIPGLGLAMPFGKFFNNTLATISDGTGLSVVGKLIGWKQERPTLELFVRAAATWTLVGSMVDKEREYREEGLGLFEGRDSTTGVVTNLTYEFPYSIYKGAARLLSYKLDNKELPDSVVDQYGEIVTGQLTRQLGDVQDSLVTNLKGLITGEFSLGEAALSLSSGAIKTTAAGKTRFLEPVNDMVGLMRGVDYTSIDKRQGSKLLNESIRYIDQVVGATAGDLEEQKYSLGKETPRPSPTKYFGLRESGPITSVQKLFNKVGIREFKPEARAAYTEATQSDNRYNQLFNTLSEQEADRLLNSNKFNEQSLKGQKILVSKMLDKVATSVKDVMRSNLLETGDRRLLKMFDIAVAKSTSDIDKALKDLSQSGEELKFEDLTEFQLDQLSKYFKYEETRLFGP